MPIWGQKCRKVHKCLAVSRKMPNFAGMKEPRFVVTGINALTGEREEISHPMSEQEARARLERELANRKYQRYAAHKRLRVERRLPIQLTINFSE